MAKLFFVLGLIACSVAFAFKSHSLPVQARASVSRRGVASLKAVVGVDDKEEVREYFNTNGFERWNKIYSDSDEVNKVQLDIRTGHQQTIDKVLNWISQDGDASKRTFCDCGCGRRAGHPAGGAGGQEGGRLRHQQQHGRRGRPPRQGPAGPAGQKGLLLGGRPGERERQVRHGHLHRRHDPLPHPQDVRDRQPPGLPEHGQAHPLLCPGHLVLQPAEEGRRALPGPLQDHPRLPAPGGGRAQGAAAGGVQDPARGDDGHQLLLLQAARGRPRVNNGGGGGAREEEGVGTRR
ncbi:unnamed protein product, partial [Heterosigma akashiwo]